MLRRSVYITMFFGPRLTIQTAHMSIYYALITIISGCALTHSAAQALGFGKRKGEWATVLSLLHRHSPKC